MPRPPPNVFQSLMRQWEAMHPYNAAQAMRLAGPIDPGRLAAAWRGAWDGLGVARVIVGPADAPPVRALPTGTDLDDHLSDELNRPIADADSPFRPFVLVERGDAHAGVVYRHSAADSVSVRRLMRGWFDRLHGRRCGGPLRSPDGGYWRHFGPTRGGWSPVAAALEQVNSMSRMKRVRRLDAVRPGDLAVRFRRFDLPDGLLGPLRSAARRDGARLGDVFLAAAVGASVRHLPLELSAQRRDLAAGTIVDLRGPGTPELGADVFGLFLGFLTTTYRPGEAADWDRRLAATVRQGRLARRDGRAAAGMVRLAVGRLAGSVLPAAQLVEFYRKRVPLAAGVSNVNLDPTWVGRAVTAPSDARSAAAAPGSLVGYLRASPAGPTLPVVFVVTTLGGRLSAGLTWRSSLLDPPAAAASFATFGEQLERYAAAAPFDNRDGTGTLGER